MKIAKKMDKIVIMLLFSISTIGLSAQNRLNNLFDVRNNKFIISSSSQLSQDKSMNVDLDSDGKKEKIIIGRSHPIGTKICVFKEQYRKQLLDGIECDESFFDEYGELNEEYYIQASCIDFNGDGKSELIISIGDKLLTLQSFIFKVRDAKEHSFKYIGKIDGQTYMYLDENNHIIAPFGSQGLFDEYICNGETILKATN